MNFTPINTEALTNLENVIKYSFDNHKDEIEDYLVFFDKMMSPTRKWFELIYCILAGTQIKTSIVKKAFEKIFDNIGYNLTLREIIGSQEISNNLETILKTSGYRFYSSKTKTIFNAAYFFKKYDKNPDKFIDSFNSYKKLRKELVKINGIGFKTASHWLRNIGIEIPIIDNHIKNIVYYCGLIEDQKMSYIEFEELIIELSKILNTKLFLLDISIWIFGREKCANNKCRDCILKLVCKKIEKKLLL